MNLNRLHVNSYTQAFKTNFIRGIVYWGWSYRTSPYTDIQAKHTQMNNGSYPHPKFNLRLTGSNINSPNEENWRFSLLTNLMRF